MGSRVVAVRSKIDTESIAEFLAAILLTQREVTRTSRSDRIVNTLPISPAWLRSPRPAYRTRQGAVLPFAKKVVSSCVWNDTLKSESLGSTVSSAVELECQVQVERVV